MTETLRRAIVGIGSAGHQDDRQASATPYARDSRLVIPVGNRQKAYLRGCRYHIRGRRSPSDRLCDPFRVAGEEAGLYRAVDWHNRCWCGFGERGDSVGQQFHLVIAFAQRPQLLQKIEDVTLQRDVRCDDLVGVQLGEEIGADHREAQLGQRPL